MIDTTEPEVMEAALKTAPGRCLLNSTHLEGGRAKADRVFALAEGTTPPSLALTIDEAGMAKTAERKLEIAQRIYDIAVDEHGLRPQDLVFDTLTFTLATGDAEFADSAIETIEGIRLIKQQLPGVLDLAGRQQRLLRPRPGGARRAQLASCCITACRPGWIWPSSTRRTSRPYAEIPAEERDLAEDLIFNRRPDALQRFIEYFQQDGPIRQPEASQVDPTKDMTPAERLHWRILHRHKDGVEADIDDDPASTSRAASPPSTKPPSASSTPCCCRR